MTQRAFALREGDQSVHVCGLAALQRLAAAEAKPTSSDRPRFVELRLPRVASGFCLEVVLPSGLIVRGSEAKQLAALVRELR